MNKAMRILGVIISAILVASLAMPALAAPPVVNVTAATGGSAISNSNIANAIWVSLTGPVLTETAPNGIGSGTIVLAAPAGFKFNIAPVTVTVGLVSGSAAKNLTLTSPNAVVTASTITITVATSSSGTSLGSLTWSGIKVMPTGCSPLATGNITMSASSTSGINLSSPNLGTLKETGSTALTFIQQPTNTLINTAIAPAVTLNACGLGAALPTVTVALTTPAGATLSGTLSATTINATGLATFSNLRVNLAGTYTLTATSPGLTSAVSSSFIIYNPVPTTTSISPASANLGATSFTMTVNGTNFVTTSVARFAGANRTTTYVSATQLTVTILTSDLTTAGPFNIDVVNPAISGVGGGTSNPQTFTVLNILPGRFNTFETSTAGPLFGNIFTKIAGTAFTLDVVALNLAKNAVLTSFTGLVKVELLNASDSTGALDANNCRSTWATIPTLVPSPNFAAADNGRKVGVSFIENNAWKEVRIRVSYPAVGAASAIGCSTDNFAIRPVVFTITSTNATNTNISGAPAIKAGSSFNLTATAVAGYNGTPSIDTSQVAGSPTAGTLAGSFGAAPVATGIATGSSFTYTEAGNFGLNANAVYDTSFTSVEQAGDCTADFSNVLVGNALVGYKYGCKIGSNAVAQTTGSSGFGRFIPDHFRMSAASITNRADLACPLCTFTYMGEKMNALFTLAADAAGNTTTQNYAGVYAKLNLANQLAFGAVDSTATPTYLTARLDTLLAVSGSFALGVATVSAPLGIFRCTAVTCPANTNPNLEDGPYAALDIGIAPADSDGVIMSAYDLDTDAVVGNDHTKVARTEVRYGRIKLANAHGSELLSLPIIATVQYWNGSYVTSATDSATQFNTNLSPAGNVQAVIAYVPLALGDISVVTPGLVTFANGVKTFTLAAPNVAGSADLAIINAPSYLLPSTTGRATFGVYKGTNEFIYLRENY